MLTSAQRQSMTAVIMLNVTIPKDHTAARVNLASMEMEGNVTVK